jgi:phage terminase small subunit
MLSIVTAYEKTESMTVEATERKLTNRQKVFINEYLKSFNATESAIKAGYSKKTAYSIGARLLKDVEIAEELRLRLSENAMSSEEVLRRLAEIARGDITDLMDVTTSGFTIDLTDKDHNINPNSKLIKKIKQKVITYLGKKDSDEDREVIETEIELYSAQDALNTLAKYHGLLVDRTDITSAGGPININVKYDDK